MDINTKKLKKNAFRVSKVRELTASRVRVPGGCCNADVMQQVVDIAARLLVFPDRDVARPRQLRDIVLDRTDRRFTQERQRALCRVAVILVAAKVEKHLIEIGGVTGNGGISPDESR